MGVTWEAISTRRNRFEANLDALRSRDRQLADLLANHKSPDSYFFQQDARQTQMGRQVGDKIEPLPNPIPAANAPDIARKLYPTGKCTEPLLIAGLDQGWLWQTIYQLNCHTPTTPGHRPPLYFLARDIERLWVVMHLHDWANLLFDGRVRLFVGEDAVDQCRKSMIDNPFVPWAKLSVTIDPKIWPAGISVDSLWKEAHESANARMQELSSKVEVMYGGMDVKALVRRLRGEKLRVMGITSLYTTFLKYSMSDWLDAFCAAGHDTLMVMERGDYEITNPLYFAKTITDFKPDLILMIDHYRAEIPGLPKQIPCVMWVQDQLPNIFSPKAGPAQGPRDYCVGFGRLQLRDQCGYPEQRFLPAQVGVNDARFAPKELSASDREKFGCDLSFVSHASVPATILLTEQLNRTDATGRKLLIDIFEKMRAIYDGGGMILHASAIEGMIQQSLQKCRFNADEPTRRGLFDFFTQRINNALFRHQSLTWAAELGLNLHLWGRGWEQHPRFGRYAKGVACNRSQLVTIYQASKINLQLMPTGAVHQRLLDGLAAGGFFLLRYVPGDVIDRIRMKMWNWLTQRNIRTHSDFIAESDSQIEQWMAESKQLMGIDLLQLWPDIVSHLRLSADSEFTRSAGTVWNEYDDICFDSRQRLEELATHYLSDDAARTHIADSMRQVVLNRFTYRAVNERLVNLIADDLTGDHRAAEAAA